MCRIFSSKNEVSGNIVSYISCKSRDQKYNETKYVDTVAYNIHDGQNTKDVFSIFKMTRICLVCKNMNIITKFTMDIWCYKQS